MKVHIISSTGIEMYSGQNLDFDRIPEIGEEMDIGNVHNAIVKKIRTVVTPQEIYTEIHVEDFPDC